MRGERHAYEPTGFIYEPTGFKNVTALSHSRSALLDLLTFPRSGVSRVNEARLQDGLAHASRTTFFAGKAHGTKVVSFGSKQRFGGASLIKVVLIEAGEEDERDEKINRPL